MNIHIHRARIHIQINEVGRRAAFRKQVFIGLHHGLVQVGAAEVAAVHKEELVAQCLAGAFRLAYIAPQGGNGRGGLNVHELANQPRPQQVLDAELEALGGLDHMDLAPVVGEREGNVRSGERHALELFHNVPELHVVALEEFSPRGDVVKEVPDGDIGAYRAAHFARAFVLGTGHKHLYAGFFTGDAGAKSHFRHGGNGGQRLSAEAEGKDMVQVFCRCKFTGGMPLKAQDGVVRSHAAAVVNHLDKRAAGIGNDHLDVRRAGIHGVLHELFYHGSGALNHLSRRNHIGNIFG